MREGAYRTGEQHPKCTIPDALVVQMRDLHDNPATSMSAYRIARQFCLNVNTVKQIVYRQRRTAKQKPVPKLRKPPPPEVDGSVTWADGDDEDREIERVMRGWRF